MTPKIRAEFELDASGHPKAIRGDKETHYRLKLFVENPPEDTSTVRYHLHESYYEPVRIVPVGVPNFEEYLTSYGDYVVKGTLHGKTATERLAAKLSDALKESYADSSNPEIEKAIEDIESH